MERNDELAALNTPRTSREQSATANERSNERGRARLGGKNAAAINAIQCEILFSVVIINNKLAENKKSSLPSCNGFRRHCWRCNYVRTYCDAVRSPARSHRSYVKPPRRRGGQKVRGKRNFFNVVLVNVKHGIRHSQYLLVHCFLANDGGGAEKVWISSFPFKSFKSSLLRFPAASMHVRSWVFAFILCISSVSPAPGAPYSLRLPHFRDSFAARAARCAIAPSARRARVFSSRIFPVKVQSARATHSSSPGVFCVLSLRRRVRIRKCPFPIDRLREI